MTKTEAATATLISHREGKRKAKSAGSTVQLMVMVASGNVNGESNESETER